MRAAIFALATLILALPAFADDSARPETHRVLVIPVDLDGHAPLTIDPAQITQALFGTTDSVAARYRTISYGKIQFTGSARDIAAPVTLAAPANFCDAGMKSLASEAEDAVAHQGFTLGNYQHFVFVLPKDAPCAWIGVGDIAGNRVWVKATTAKAFQHELGHNLGMNHAVDWHGANAEASDFMGSGEASLNAPHVVEMGWLQHYPGKVIEMTRAGDVTLEAIENDPTQSALPKVVILRPASGANIYYLSYRATSAANPLPDDFTRGVNIHIFDPTRQVGGLSFFMTSLADGTSYSDGPLIVQQLSHSANHGVTVHISFGGKGAAIPAGPPPAPPGTLQSLGSGKCLDLPGGRTADAVHAIQYDCHGGPNQLWDMKSSSDADVAIVSRLSGKCLEIDPYGTTAASHIEQLACDRSPAQLWTLEPSRDGFVVKNAATRFCLDVPGGSATNGIEPIAWTCNGGSNQTWRYVAPTMP